MRCYKYSSPTYKSNHFLIFVDTNAVPASGYSAFRIKTNPNPVYNPYTQTRSIFRGFPSCVSDLGIMKFGKEFRIHLEQTLPEWRDKFLRYKRLKKLLKQISVTEGGAIVLDDQSSSDAVVGTVGDVGACRTGGDRSYGQPVVNNEAGRAYYPSGFFAGRTGQEENRPRVYLEEWFVRILDEELDKFNDFYVDKEEEFVIRLQELKERIERVRETSSKRGVFTSESKFSEEMVDIRKEFVKIHGEMVLLKNYSSLNFAGLVKILKKYDKRTGALLRLPFMQCALRQPFFTTEPLTRLVRECEANLELLFPLEGEVVELGAPNVTEKKTPETSSSVREKDTVDMHRSILAAKRAIEGLRRASSTYNPLSLGYFLQGQDDDEAGAVTSVNSVTNEECDGEDVLSSK